MRARCSASSEPSEVLTVLHLQAKSQKAPLLEVADLFEVGFLNSVPHQVISAANQSAARTYGATPSTLSSAVGGPACAPVHTASLRQSREQMHSTPLSVT